MNNEFNEVIDKELDWEDEIKEESSFTLLPEGDYNFKVISFKRKRHDGSKKLPACPKAELEIEVNDDKGNKTTVYHNLFLHTKCEGMLSAFFIAIGQKKHGEPFKMDWNKVYGATGRCKLEINRWKNDKGEEKENNRIKRFYEPVTKPAFTPGHFGSNQ